MVYDSCNENERKYNDNNIDELKKLNYPNWHELDSKVCSFNQVTTQVTK